MKIEIVKPEEIEKRSFEIIREELKRKKIRLEEETAPVILRCIHTSADFDYVSSLYFSDHVMEIAHEALMRGENIITDTNMALAGINKKKLAFYGGKAYCFMSDPDVAEEAKSRGVTRAVVSMERAAALGGHPIIALGNAPTALLHLCELIKTEKIRPSLVIGAPVGFVNVIASKELLLGERVPKIVARGNKGGSNIAARICNALLYTL